MEAQYRTSLNRPKHVNTDNLYYLSVLSSTPQSELREALESLPCVKRIGWSRGVPGFPWGQQWSLTRDGQTIAYVPFMMDTSAFQMFDIEIIKDYHTPIHNSVWFSEKSFAATGLDDNYRDISQTLAQKTRG